jgi:C_GCAxxG_C_C family probable redox protein
MNEEIPMRAYERGFEFERRYHGCSQCVVGALHEVFPHLRDEGVFKAACGLAGGVGLCTKGQCGALSGAVMVLGQEFGRRTSEFDDIQGKRFVAYRLAEKMTERFLEHYGSVICGDIQERLMGKRFYLWNPDQLREFQEAGGHEEVCPSVVGNAAKWAVELLLELKDKQSRNA